MCGRYGPVPSSSRAAHDRPKTVQRGDEEQDGLRVNTKIAIYDGDDDGGAGADDDDAALLNATGNCVCASVLSLQSGQASISACGCTAALHNNRLGTAHLQNDTSSMFLTGLLSRICWAKPLRGHVASHV